MLKHLTINIYQPFTTKCLYICCNRVFLDKQIIYICCIITFTVCYLLYITDSVNWSSFLTNVPYLLTWSCISVVQL
jgi:hypothetical protein